MKIIMSEKKTVLSSVIETKSITELNNLIYAGAKLVCEKVGFPQKYKNKMA